MKFSKEIKVGLLAIVSITILYLGFNFLKGIDLFKETNNYYALYENIDGLTISNPVVINGLSVGRVSNIEILQQQGNKVAASLRNPDGRNKAHADELRAAGATIVEIDVTDTNQVIFGTVWLSMQGIPVFLAQR